MKKGTPSIHINMVMNVILTMSSIIFPMLTLPYITRVLGAEGVGRVYFASSAISVFAVFAELGIPVYGIRACARVRDDREELSRTVSEIIMINLIACCAAYICLAAAIRLVPRFAQDRLLILIMSSSMLLNCLGAEWLYKALEKYTYITVRSVVFKLAALIAMFIVVRGSEDYIIYGFLTIFAASASNILNFCRLRRYADLRLPSGSHALIPFDVLKKHLPGMLMLFALAAATTVYTNMDLAILGLMKGDAEAGLYGVAVRIKLVTVSIVTAISAVLLPRNSFYYEKGRKDEFYGLTAATLRMVVMISVPTAIYFILYARESIWILAGAEFAGAAWPMMIIMPSVIVIGVSNVIGMQMLVPAGRERTVVMAAICGAAVDLLLNLILIPRMASSGAALATLAAEICVAGYMLYNIREDLPQLTKGFPGGSVFAGAGVFAASGSLLRGLHCSPLVMMGIAAILSGGLYVLVIYTMERRRHSDL